MIRSFEDKTPRIHPSVFVSESAYVVGDVDLGEGVTVWPRVVIRGDLGKIVIGRNTAVEDGSIIHGTITIGDHTVIGHSVIIHARSVGSHCLLGNKAIVNEGVEIGDWCMVAAASVVRPRMVVPPRSMVMGHPAEIRRALRPEQEHGLITRYQIHPNLAKRYLENGNPTGDAV